ncbi:hypothetical protein SDJN03_22879, partial [Cucurbita argyrosperma subsp. sororia]
MGGEELESVSQGRKERVGDALVACGGGAKTGIDFKEAQSSRSNKPIFIEPDKTLVVVSNSKHPLTLFLSGESFVLTMFLSAVCCVLIIQDKGVCEDRRAEKQIALWLWLRATSCDAMEIGNMKFVI